MAGELIAIGIEVDDEGDGWILVRHPDEFSQRGNIVVPDGRGCDAGQQDGQVIARLLEMAFQHGLQLRLFVRQPLGQPLGEIALHAFGQAGQAIAYLHVGRLELAQQACRVCAQALLYLLLERADRAPGQCKRKYHLHHHCATQGEEYRTEQTAPQRGKQQHGSTPAARGD